MYAMGDSGQHTAMMCPLPAFDGCGALAMLHQRTVNMV